MLFRWARHLKNRLVQSRPVSTFARGASFAATSGGQWYDPVLLSPETIGHLATNATTLRSVVALLERLEPDDYLRFISAYYREGLSRYGDYWVYADILSVLSASCSLLRPESYLEIGVRRGRSLAVVVASNPNCRVVGFDLWIEGYAGMPNPGPEFVRREMKKFGHVGALELVSGASRKTVPRYFAENPDAFFDLITVDGDHSERGARDDLNNVIPRLKIGGVLVFDDISHPHHPGLRSAWSSVVAGSSSFRTWTFSDLGFGVGVAVRVR